MQVKELLSDVLCVVVNASILAGQLKTLQEFKEQATHSVQNVIISELQVVAQRVG